MSNAAYLYFKLYQDRFMLKTILLFLLASPLLVGQSKIFNADYRFPEGVYLSHDALLAGVPDLEWEAIAGEMVQLPEDFRVQVAGYGYNDIRISADILPYAISLDGQVYFFTRYDEKRNFHEFTGLRVQGNLSTIQYDTTIHTRQLMKAYNPVNGLPFRQAYVDREKKITLYKILHLRSGTLLPFSRKSLLKLCANDVELTKALREADPNDQDILLRALKLYDDRHPLSLPLE
jgi:hypothetical protein